MPNDPKPLPCPECGAMPDFSEGSKGDYFECPNYCLSTPERLDQAEAIAAWNLAASARGLLEALIEMEQGVSAAVERIRSYNRDDAWLGGWSINGRPAIYRARAAIRKARGEG